VGKEQEEIDLPLKSSFFVPEVLVRVENRHAGSVVAQGLPNGRFGPWPAHNAQWLTL
jgi:hypothetical protein